MRLAREGAVSMILALLMATGVSLGTPGDAEGWKAKRRGKGGHHGKHHSKHHHYSHRYRYGYYGGYYGYPYYRGYGYWRGYGSRRAYRRETASERGFRYLVDGDAKRAVSVFAKLAESQPDNAMPKLGYAIAMSELRELELGVWAMRRAILTDPAALQNAPIDSCF